MKRKMHSWWLNAQKSVSRSLCVEKCLEDRRWLAGNMQASPPRSVLQTSISHWLDFILRVRTALLITANSCNSVVVPDIQSSFFPTKTISEVLWNEMTTPLLRHPGLRSLCSSPVQRVHKWSSLQTHPCHHPWGVEEAPDALPSLPGWDWAQSLGKWVWGQAGLETSRADPFTLPSTTLETGQWAGL